MGPHIKTRQKTRAEATIDVPGDSPQTIDLTEDDNTDELEIVSMYYVEPSEFHVGSDLGSDIIVTSENVSDSDDDSDSVVTLAMTSQIQSHQDAAHQLLSHMEEIVALQDHLGPERNTESSLIDLLEQEGMAVDEESTGTTATNTDPQCSTVAVPVVSDVQMEGVETAPSTSVSSEQTTTNQHDESNTVQQPLDSQLSTNQSASTSDQYNDFLDVLNYPPPGPDIFDNVFTDLNDIMVQRLSSRRHRHHRNRMLSSRARSSRNNIVDYLFNELVFQESGRGTSDDTTAVSTAATVGSQSGGSETEAAEDDSVQYVREQRVSPSIRPPINNTWFQIPSGPFVPIRRTPRQRRRRVMVPIVISPPDSPVLSSRDTSPPPHVPVHPLPGSSTAPSCGGKSSPGLEPSSPQPRFDSPVAIPPSALRPPVCPICQDGLAEILSSRRTLLSTLCGHLFCSSCLPTYSATTVHMSRWFRCPICSAHFPHHKPGYHPVYW